MKNIADETLRAAGVRMWARVDRNGPRSDTAQGRCWVWVGPKSNDGYGTVSAVPVGGGRSKEILVHRLSWFLESGVRPSKLVLHKCDHPSCVRPSHLFEGSDADNVADMNAKRRNPVVIARREQTHCVNGHEFSEVNTYRHEGSRSCRKCNSAAQRKYRSKP